MLLVTHADEVSEQFERVEHLEELNRVVAAAAWCASKHASVMELHCLVFIS